MIISGLAIGLFFLQETGAANSTYFSSNSFIFLSIYTALVIGFWQKKLGRRFGIIIFITVIIFSIPRSLYETVTLYRNFIIKDYLLIDEKQRALIDHVVKNTSEDALFLSGIQEFELLSQRPIFMGDHKGYDILLGQNVDTAYRKNVVDRIYQTKDAQEATRLLCENHIEYFLGKLRVTNEEEFSDVMYEQEGWRYSKVRDTSCKNSP
jgi:hypothetical protein